MSKKNPLPFLVVIAIMSMMCSCKKNTDQFSTTEKKSIAPDISTTGNNTNTTASFKTPAVITIEAHSVRGCPTPGSCHFIASGAINDEGTIESLPTSDHALYSPVVGTFQWTRTFIGAHGSITISLQSSVHVPDALCILNEEGRWIIIAATGDYEGLKGEGDETGIRNYCETKLDAVYKGLVH